VLAPDQPDPVAATVVQFSIRNWNNEPIRDPVVVFEPGPGLRFCVGMGFSTIGDEEGRATMVLRGAGCLQDVSGAARFRANGVIIRDYRNAKSPDWDGSGANGQVDLADLVRFSSFTDSCFDFNNNGGIDLGDTIIFTNGFSPAHRCQLQ